MLNRALFNAGLFERALAFLPEHDVLNRILCLIELQRDREAVALADAALALRPDDGDVIALRALAAEADEDDPAPRREANERAAELGSPYGVINLARIATVEGRFGEVPEIVARLQGLATTERQRLIGDLLVWQAQFLGGKTRDAAATARAMEERLGRQTAYDTIHMLTFFVKHAIIANDRAGARTYLSALGATLQHVPPCRFHRTHACLAARMRKNGGFIISYRGAPPRDNQKAGSLPATIRRRPILASMYSCIQSCGGDGAQKAEIAAAVWGLDYNPVRHDARIYKALNRLRTNLEDDPTAEHQLVPIGDRFTLQPKPRPALSHPV